MVHGGDLGRGGGGAGLTGSCSQLDTLNRIDGIPLNVWHRVNMDGRYGHMDPQNTVSVQCPIKVVYCGACPCARLGSHARAVGRLSP